jgi:hypothetical protein
VTAARRALAEAVRAHELAVLSQSLEGAAERERSRSPRRSRERRRRRRDDSGHAATPRRGGEAPPTAPAEALGHDEPPLPASPSEERAGLRPKSKASPASPAYRRAPDAWRRAYQARLVAEVDARAWERVERDRSRALAEAEAEEQQQQQQQLQQHQQQQQAAPAAASGSAPSGDAAPPLMAPPGQWWPQRLATGLARRLRGTAPPAEPAGWPPLSEEAAPEAEEAAPEAEEAALEAQAVEVPAPSTPPSLLRSSAGSSRRRRAAAAQRPAAAQPEPSAPSDEHRRRHSRPHFKRGDPRHTGPRLLHDLRSGVEICRQFNRGSCSQGDCPHRRSHACSRCGQWSHAAFSCVVAPDELPPKEGAQ